MELLTDAFMDALIDSAKMLPLLFLVYMVIEIAEVKWGNKTGKVMAKAGKAGPLIGAVAGIIPQCGISVVGTALYAQRLVTIGTLIAVYLATSDEAIPIILSQPDALPVLLPLLGVKLVAAIVVGYALDVVFRKRNARILEHVEHYASGQGEQGHDHQPAYEEKGCCGHEPTPDDHKLTVRTVLLHPLKHTLKIFVWLFVISLALTLLFELVGQDAIASALVGHTFLQPVLAAVVGLIPNCAASVAITEFYLEGVITFGAAVSGLCASGGLGILVLLKEEKRAEALKIIGGLFCVSVAIGLLVQLLPLG